MTKCDATQQNSSNTEREDATNLGEKLGLDNQRSIGGEVALAENLEVAVSGDVDDRDLLLGEGLWRVRMRL